MDIENLSFFDLHRDTPSAILNGKAADLEGLSRFENYCACFAAFVGEDEPRPFERAKSQISAFLAEFERQGSPCKTVLTLENGASVGEDTDKLDFFARLGVKAANLTWNGENMLASGCMAEGGLKPAGKRFICKLNELSLSIDLAHINKQGFYEAVELAQRPFVSHTAAFELNPHLRNITLDMARQVSDRNGIIGLCFYPVFLPECDVFEAVYKSLYFWCDKGLSDNICIGSDFEGADMSPQLSSPYDAKSLWEFLLSRGFSEALLKKIFWQNAADFFSQSNQT